MFLSQLNTAIKVKIDKTIIIYQLNNQNNNLMKVQCYQHQLTVKHKTNSIGSILLQIYFTWLMTIISS